MAGWNNIVPSLEKVNGIPSLEKVTGIPSSEKGHWYLLYRNSANYQTK